MKNIFENKKNFLKTASFREEKKMNDALTKWIVQINENEKN